MLMVSTFDFNDSNHQDSFWYKGDVLMVENAIRKVVVSAVGDILIRISTEDGRSERFIFGPEDLTPEEYAQGDAWLYQFPQQCWGNNNWFEFSCSLDGKWLEAETEVAFVLHEAFNMAKEMAEDDEWWKYFEEEA